MKANTTLWRAHALLLICTLVAPCFAQTPRPTGTPSTRPSAPVAQATEQANVTIDTLLAADTYAIYGEVRGLGQYINSKEVQELLAPLRLPGGAPQELLDLINFLSAHADALQTARVMFAATPVRPKLPDGFVAAEFSSVEQAQQFEAQLRAFLTAHVKPKSDEPAPNTTALKTTTTKTNPDGTTTTTTSVAPLPAPSATAQMQTQTPTGRAASRRANAVANKVAATAPPFFVERVGALVVASDTQFSVAALRPAGAPLLTDEAGFQAARARFAHEMLFVYFNTKRIERNAEEQRKKYEQEAARQRAEMRRNQGAPQVDDNDETPVGVGAQPTLTAQAPTPEPTQDENAGNIRGEMIAVPTATATLPPVPPNAEAEPTPDEPPAPVEEKKLTPEEQAQADRQRANEQFLSLLPSVVFGGMGSSNSLPESIALAGELDGDSLVVRALFVKEGDDRAARPIPFVPILLSGPAITPEAANVVPADTDVLVSASLDLPQMYDYVASMLRILDVAATTGGQGRKGANESFDSQLSAFEKSNGFRIKDDLIAALGNEIAVAAPARWLGVGNRMGRRQNDNSQGAGGPLFIISLNDKRALQELLPRALGAFGLQGVGAQALLEKQGDVELLNFSQGTIAFIDRFLVVAPDAPTMRHVIDAYNKRDTLSTSDAYRNSARWQPRQVLGQIYVSSALLKEAFDNPKEDLDLIDDVAVRDVLLRLNPEPGAITHALTKDDEGLLHELHIPKEVLALMTADELVSQQLAPLRTHESQARFALQGIAEAQEKYKREHGRYGSLEEIKEASKGEVVGDNGARFSVTYFVTEAEGYEIKLNTSDDKFEVTATPTVYRKTGRLSFYIDQTKTLRAADLNGRTADASAPTAY